MEEINIKQLSLYNFKNYAKNSFDFSTNINVFYGKNGVGKTTILDAIYFLITTKSYFQHVDAALIRHSYNEMYAKGILAIGQHIFGVKNEVRLAQKKEIWWNEKKVIKHAEVIGRMPCVMIAPDDINVITEGSEKRRKLMDTCICQYNSTYLEYLMNYNKVLQQRNSYLKGLDFSSTINKELLSIYNESLNKYGTYIFEEREKFCEQFSTLVTHYYSELGNQSDEVTVMYSSQLQQNSLKELLENNPDKDRFSQRTNYGIHKDDLIITLNHFLLKETASQGQRKTCLFALKFAQLKLIEQCAQKYPLLLLDDIFEKLDLERSKKLITYITSLQSQIFITDTHYQRVLEMLGNSNSVKYIEIA